MFAPERKPRAPAPGTRGASPAPRPAAPRAPAGLPLFLARAQAKLTVGRADDPLEYEADRVADQVADAPASAPPVPRAAPQSAHHCPGACACADCQHAARAAAQRPRARAPEAAGHAASPTSAEGVPLPDDARRFMEHRFGAEFTAVRIHTGAEDDRLAGELGAEAFTVGRHIHFRQNRFDPDGTAGRRLLAHELTHTLQQGAGAPVIRRKTDAEWNADATKLETQILSAPAYGKLSEPAKADVAFIIERAKLAPAGQAKGERLHYLKRLLVAVTTPSAPGKGYGCSGDTAKRNRAVVKGALETEARWDKLSEGKFADLDERIVATGTHKVERTGEQGKTFLVDGTDPRNIRVQIKIQLLGAKEEVDDIRKLEDAIERSVAISTRGYHLDIVFVDAPGPDVFEFTVHFCEWPNSGNWASGPVTLSHEVHHALGLDDRYDYIEHHAGNRSINVERRLSLFAEQMQKATGARDPFSKMGSNRNALLAEDVCAVAFPGGPERAKCIEARKDLDPPGVPPLP